MPSLAGAALRGVAPPTPTPSMTLLVTDSSDSSNSFALERDDGMVFLPRPSPLVQILCVALYLALAVVTAARFLSAGSTSATVRLRPDALKRQRTFQKLMILFASVRAVSFVTQALLRDLLNRLALCLFFSLVLFQVLFWIDIANPKVSLRSQRIWNTFVLANAVFYAVVLGLCVLFHRQHGASGDHPAQAQAWDLVSVLLIALGSLAAALGLLYSTCKTRRRVGRVLQQFASQSLPERLNQRVEAKLQRALRVTNAIMGVCTVVFLLRTVLYIQRPFSHQECGAIRDPNACILIGYGIPELVPCVLFLVLMWEVEPQLEFPSRRKSSVNAVAVARVTESTPLLLERRHTGDLATDTQVYNGRGRHARTQRPSPLSSALGGNVIEAARLRLKRVLEESFGVRSDEESSSTSLQHPGVQRVLSASDSSSREHSPAMHSRSRESSGSSAAREAGEGDNNEFVWMSFQCFRLKLPSMTDQAVLLVLHRGEAEVGRTEIAYSADPSFHVLVPVDISDATSLRASVYAITRPRALNDLNAQWLVGSATLSPAAYVSDRSGTATVHSLYSPLSKTYASGELVVRCEAPLAHGPTTQLQRVAKAFVFQPFNSRVAGAKHPPKLIVEEELIESVYTWEIPYQLLQLVLSDLVVQLDVLKRAVMEPSPSAARESEHVQSPVIPTRNSHAPSVGMLSEMIMQIQGDALERKSKKWGEELVVKMEKYLDDVEAAILRYEQAHHNGLTFKPSTMKADADLRFLALNLHQQLMVVGDAVPPSLRDILDSTSGDGERYVKLLDAGVHAVEDAESSLRMMRAQQVSERLFDESGSEDEEDGGEEDREVAGLTAISSSTVAEREEPRSRTPEPFEALRRRVISFDSAETIVSQGRRGAPLSREQRQLAESIVALGVETALDVEGLAGCSPEPPVKSINRTSQIRRSTRRDSMPVGGQVPFKDHGMYGTTTVGAFAAHVYGFRKGGIRQLRATLSKLSERMAKETKRVGSELTVEALEREYAELKWHIDRRLEVAFSQALSALATCFQQTLYVHLYARVSTLADSAKLRALGVQYLEQLAAVGFVFSVESLLSTYSKEAGMLGDMEAAVRELERVRIKLRPVVSPKAAQFRVLITAGAAGMVIELPIILASSEQYHSRSMHRVLGQDAPTGAVYLSLATPDEWTRAHRVVGKPINVIPVIFSQGVNEMQTVANTVGKDALQKEINAENLVVLERQVDEFESWWKQAHPNYLHDGEKSSVHRMRQATAQLRDHIQRSGAGKHMDILSISSSIARLLGGGRVTCCKSAKDRTAMSVTLEESSLLVAKHGVRPTDRDLFTALLRTHGVRRENARKNIGHAQYCFSAIQNYLLPTEYQCPPGTGGGSGALS